MSPNETTVQTCPRPRVLAAAATATMRAFACSQVTAVGKLSSRPLRGLARDEPSER